MEERHNGSNFYRLLEVPDSANASVSADTAKPVIEARGLTKRYGGSVFAVNGLSLKVNRGEVYGFLGPNGAGKTTTLRMLLGLVKPTSGIVEVLGSQPGPSSSTKGVGSLVESPAFYPYLSGRDNLRVMGRHSGGISRDHISHVLWQVGLSERQKDKYKKYSLGMKQRLGTAAALLEDPELLILDEPTNGLDPKGMSEMRELIRELGRGQRTVLLSSHLMHEVEQICDRVGVVRRGEVAFEGFIEELRGDAELALRAEPRDRAVALVEQMPRVREVRVEGETIVISANPEISTEISQTLGREGVLVKELRESRQSLEEIFLQLTDEEG